MKKALKPVVLFSLLFVLLCTSCIGAGAKDASSDYSASTVTKYNGHLYQLVFASMTWESADSYAKSLGGHLVTITSAKEQNYVWNLTQKWTNVFSGHYWLGATDKATEGTWVWTTGEKFSYTNWGSGEPNGKTSQNYALIGHYSNGTWDDEDNSPDKTTGFIIEWDGYVSSFKLSFTSITMTKGGTVSLSLIKNKTYGYYTSVSYKSSKKSVVSVTSSGKLKAKKAGTATITVTMKANGKTIKKTCKVKVTS